MKKLLAISLLALALSGCSIKIDQPAMPTVTASPPPSSQGTQIPITWGDLHLTGKLIYISHEDTADSTFMVIQMFDLETGRISTLFKAPDQAFIYALTLSPDHKQLIMSYALPSDKDSFGLPVLYAMPLDASQPPKLLFAPPSKDDQYFQPLWVSAGGKDYLYFSHARSKGPSKTGTQNLAIDLDRMALPDGPQEKIAESAFWPAVSADGSRLVYVSINPEDGTNQLISANPDGTDAHKIALTGDWVPHYIDAPAFLPDGKTLLFSAVSVSEKPAALTWLDQLFGVTVASAHNVPSDWWTVPVDGGAVTQLTHLQTTALFASILPDQHIISYSGYGIFVMNPDGSGLRMLLNDVGGIPSSLNWIP